MNNDILQYLTWALFLFVFASALAEFVRTRSRANLNITLALGALALIVTQNAALEVGLLPATHLGSAINAALFLALPYLFLRLVAGLAGVPRPILVLALLVWIAAAALVFAFEQPRPPWTTAFLVVYFATVQGYGTWVLVRQARRATGVARRRKQAAAAGTALLIGVVVVAGARLVAPQLEELWSGAISVLAVTIAGAFIAGFAPPEWLRRAWREPGLRTMLRDQATVARMPSREEMVRELERSASATIGAHVVFGIWDPDRAVLRFRRSEALDAFPAAISRGRDRDGNEAPPGEFWVRSGEMAAGRAFAQQRALYVEDAIRDDPDNAPLYRHDEVHSVMVAPITGGERRMGVLAAFVQRAPLFAEEDMEVARLLADHAAFVLEARELIEAEARVAALAQATREREDFLAAAAHDLKTPLARLLSQAQLMELRARRNPAAPTRHEDLEFIVAETRRLRTLVVDLLDASRVERGRTTGDRAEVNLAQVFAHVDRRFGGGRHRLTFATEGNVTGTWDGLRIGQVIENLVENAIRYSPDGGSVEVRAWDEGDLVRLTVSDEGMGIPAQDLPRIFDRFHRAGNVADRDAGLGLGLYIVRGIIEEHDGSIDVESVEGQGSTFRIALPRSSGAARAATGAGEEAATP